MNRCTYTAAWCCWAQKVCKQVSICHAALQRYSTCLNRHATQPHGSSESQRTCKPVCLCHQVAELGHDRSKCRHACAMGWCWEMTGVLGNSRCVNRCAPTPAHGGAGYHRQDYPCRQWLQDWETVCLNKCAKLPHGTTGTQQEYKQM